MGIIMELVLLSAQYARGSGAPMMTMNRILSDWQRAGIKTPEAARAEHESHVRGSQQGVPQPVRTQDVMQRHQYTVDDYRSMVIDLDEEDS